MSGESRELLVALEEAVGAFGRRLQLLERIALTATIFRDYDPDSLAGSAARDGLYAAVDDLRDHEADAGLLP